MSLFDERWYWARSHLLLTDRRLSSRLAAEEDPVDVTAKGAVHDHDAPSLVVCRILRLHLLDVGPVGVVE